MADTIRTRFAASLAANILRSGISFGTGLLLARWLGPDDYGRMAFLLASFLAFRQLLDMGSSSAFFTFLSQRTRSKRFVSYYWRWVGVQFFVSLLLVGFLLPGDWVAGIWKGEGRGMVLLALIAAFMQNVVWSVASQMAEAQRETIRLQRLNLLVVVFHLCAMLMLWQMGHLVIPLIFVALALEWGLAGWFAARLYRGQAGLGAADVETNDTPASVWKEFWHYSLPFIPYAWLGFACSFADCWMLQHWGGASEQAYYAVASQFAAVALLATTSILNIFWKEIAEAHHHQNHSRVGLLYLKSSRGLYFVGSVVAGGLMPWAREITFLTLGPAYAGGAATLMLMFFYPVHQSLGQIGSTIFYATGHTRIQVVLGMSYMVASMVVAYFVMAPADATIPGFGLASKGLAYKMVILQVIVINIMTWFISRIIGSKFDWSYQFVGLGLALGGGWLAKSIVTGLVKGPELIAMASAVPIYIVIMAAALYLMPWVAGVSRDEISQAISVIKRRR